MGIFRDDWQELTESRNVGSIYLTHLIRGRSDNDSYNTLLKILESGFLRASFSKRSGHNTVKGDKEVVCFQDTSFDEMNEVITGEKWIEHEQIYREFGIQISKELLFRDGARPVIYDKANEIMELIDESIYWRVVNLDLNIATWQYVDWTHEHEWRIPGDVMLESGDFRVIVKTEEYKKRLIHEPGMKKLIKKPKNIIVFENEVSKNIELS